MGGFSFFGKEDQIYYMNLFIRNSWLNAVVAAREEINCKCSFDEDGECEKRGCLNRDGELRGRLIAIADFKAMNQRVLNFVKNYPERLPHIYVSWAPEGKVYESGADHAIPILEDVIKAFDSALKSGETEAYMYDRLSDPDGCPCPRYLMFRRVPNTNEIDEYLRQGVGIPDTILLEKLISYDDALILHKNGEWEKNIKEAFDFSDPESIEPIGDITPSDIPF